MHTTLENRKKATRDFPISALKRNNKVEDGGVLSSGVKREHESINARAQKMMKGMLRIQVQLVRFH